MNRFTNKFHTDLKHLTKKEMNMTDETRFKYVVRPKWNENHPDVKSFDTELEAMQYAKQWRLLLSK